MNFLVSLIANFLYLIDKRRKKVVFTNLDLVFPNMSEKDKKKLAKKVYYNFVYNIFETLKLKKVPKNKLEKIVEIQGIEKIRSYKNKPIIFITAHYGNWELVGITITKLLKIPLTVVIRKKSYYVKQKFLNKIFQFIYKVFINPTRNEANIEVIDKEGALKNLIKAIKKGNSIGLFVDQNTAKNEGIDVEIFGLKALQVPTAALLSKKFGLPVVPVFIKREGKKYKFIIKDPILEKDIKKSVQLQSKVIEEVIKEKPEEWYWFHRRFKHYYEDKYV